MDFSFLTSLITYIDGSPWNDLFKLMQGNGMVDGRARPYPPCHGRHRPLLLT
jgi:hypothetical protein